MRKLTFAFAVLASLGGAALVQPASAAPAMPGAVAAPDAVTQVRMHPDGASHDAPPHGAPDDAPPDAPPDDASPHAPHVRFRRRRGRIRPRLPACVRALRLNPKIPISSPRIVQSGGRRGSRPIRETRMPSSNRLFDDLARLMTDAAGAAQGVRREAETVVRAQLERVDPRPRHRLPRGARRAARPRDQPAGAERGAHGPRRRPWRRESGSRRQPGAAGLSEVV